MGVFGLRKYVEAHNVTRLIKDRCDGVNHLCLDMNGLMHTVYNPRRPTASATLESLTTLLLRLISLFPPSTSIIAAFDGPAPLSKLRTQRDRRKSMASEQPKGMELNEAQIVCGSPFVLEAELHVERLLLGLAADRKLSVESIVINGCTTPGEGECKITQHLLRRAASPAYNPDEVTVIVGNDSDLVLNCIACTPFHNLFVVNPYSLIMTCVSDLIYHWVKSGSGVSPAFLPALRMDFVFITLLAGGDHYPGIENGVSAIWKRYREIRAAGSFSRQPLIRPDYTINGQLLSAITHEPTHRTRQSHYAGSKNKRKVEKEKAMMASAGNPTTGLKLLSCSLWSLATTCDGRCPDYGMIFKGEAPKPGALRCAADTAARARVPTSDTQPLKPLQVYVAVMTNPLHMPAPVRAVLERDDKLKRITSYDSTTSILGLISDIFTQVDASQWTAQERALLEFGELRSYSIDSEGAATLLEDGSATTAPPLQSVAGFEYPLSVSELHFVTFGSKHLLTISLPKGRSGGAGGNAPTEQQQGSLASRVASSVAAAVSSVASAIMGSSGDATARGDEASDDDGSDCDDQEDE